MTIAIVFLVGVGVGMAVMGILAVSGRTELEQELLLSRQKLRDVLRGDLPR